jgi:DNA-binding PadR family transcriptional regulator
VALPHAILVSLCEQSGSGYELARRFDRSIGYFWAATHQQIYRTLKVMEDDGRVSVTPVVQKGRPDKKVYTVSDAGRAELARWIAEPLSGRGSSVADNRTGTLQSRFVALSTAMSTRFALRFPRCEPSAPTFSTSTALSRSVSSPTPADCLAAHCISTWCCAAVSAPRRARSTGSTK